MLGVWITLVFFTIVGQMTSIDATGRGRGRGRIRCDMPEEPMFGSYKLNKRQKTLTYTCDPGFELKGLGFKINRVRCVGKRWRPSGKGDCYPKEDRSGMCPKLYAPLNGNTIPEKVVGNVGETVTFYCDEGYVLDGPHVRRCLRGGKWDGIPGSCESRKTVEDLAEALKDKFIDELSVGTGRTAHKNSRITSGKNGLDLVFLMDHSSSIGATALQKGKDFMKMIVKTFNVSSKADGGKAETRFALITFADEPTVRFNLNDPVIRSIDKVSEAIDAIPETKGGTNFIRALDAVYIEVYSAVISKDPERNSGAERAVFLITDAEETHDPSAKRRIKNTARNLKNKSKADFEIFTIGVGKFIDESFLAELASAPYVHHVFLVDKFDDLKKMADIISEKNIDYNQCGISGETKTTGNSGVSNKDAWPWLGWLSLIHKNTARTCGGTVICRRWFLTAAHCVYNDKRKEAHPAKKVEVHLGDYALYESGSDMILKPKRILIHPAYNRTPNEYGVRDFDIALIDFGEDNATLPVFHKYVKPICVADNSTPGVLQAFEAQLAAQKSKDNDEGAGVIAGWGFHPNLHRKPVVLPFPKVHQSQQRVRPDDKCARFFPGLKTDMFLCVGNYYSSDVCRAGDVGGPYMSLVYKKIAMLGIALKTDQCDVHQTHSLYLNVLHPDIVSWLGENLRGCNFLTRE